MFYEEQVVDGVLCFRNTPDGEWEPLSASDLTAELMGARQLIKGLRQQLVAAGAPGWPEGSA